MSKLPVIKNYRRLGLLIWLSIALLCVPAALRAGQAPPSGAGKLVEIHATGSKQFSSDRIAAVTGLHIGQMVHKEDFQAAADRLSALGYFSEVRYRFGSKGVDVTVEFQVQDAPFAAVAFDNFPWYSDEELGKALRDAGFLFDGTAPLQGSILDDMAQTLQKLLESRGIHAVVEHSVLAGVETENQFQQFHVVGPGLLVGSVQFTDEAANRDARIQDRLSDIVGKPYSRYAIEVFTFEQVRPIYLSQGRLRVTFGKPTVQVTGNPTKPLPDTVKIVVSVDPGPVYKLAAFTWTGNHIFAASEFENLIGLHAGDPADGMKLLAAWDRVHAAYERRGFLDVQLAPQPGYDEKVATASYHVAITEGPQYHMGDLVLTGLSLEGERRIRTAWALGKGAVFDKQAYDDFVDQGAKLAFGDLPVHYEQIGRFLRTDPKTATVDVLLDFH